MRLTVRRLMTAAVFAAFAAIGPLPLLRHVWLPETRWPEVVFVAVSLGLVMACLSCLVPTLVLLKGRMRLWVFRLLLTLACLFMSVVWTVGFGLMLYHLFKMVSYRGIIPHLDYWLALVIVSCAPFALALGLLFFVKRVLPRHCPACGRRRLIFVDSQRIGALRQTQRACLACKAEFSTPEGPVAFQGPDDLHPEPSPLL